MASPNRATIFCLTSFLSSAVCAILSASMTRQPNLPSSEATAVLPEPIPPKMPIIGFLSLPPTPEQFSDSLECSQRILPLLAGVCQAEKYFVGQGKTTKSASVVPALTPASTLFATACEQPHLPEPGLLSPAVSTCADTCYAAAGRWFGTKGDPPNFRASLRCLARSRFGSDFH